VPVLSPHLSSHWLNLVTDVDTAAGRSLVDSMVNEVVVKDDSLHRLVPFGLRSFDEAVAEALEEREEELSQASGWKARLRAKLPMSLSYKVPIRHEESEEVRRRRRRVVLGTSVVGAGLLGFGLSTKPGSAAFYGSTLAVAGIYTAGGLASGPLHLGWIQLQDRSLNRPIITPILTGAGAFGVFYAGAHVVKLVPPLGKAVATVLQFADEGDERLLYLTTLSNGVAEEIFFRGAVYAALQDLHPTLTSTGVYMVATIPTRNPMLVFAAGLMGLLWGAQRRASHGLQAPVLTHLTWSSLMLRYLPPVFADVVPEQTRGARADVTRGTPRELGTGAAKAAGRRWLR
jgi:membrane protease YdiL (CAAX protease family)